MDEYLIRTAVSVSSAFSHSFFVVYYSMSSVSVEGLRAILSQVDMNSLYELQDTPDSLAHLIHRFPFKGSPNRSLQYCLIRELCKDKKKLNTLKELNPYWERRDLLLNGHSIREIEQSVGITETKPFDLSVNNFRKLESMLNIGINCYLVVYNKQFDSQGNGNSFDAAESADEPSPDQTVFESQYDQSQRVIVNLCLLYIPSKPSIRYFVISRISGFLTRHPVRVEIKKTACSCDYCDYSTTSKERMTIHQRLDHCSILSKNDRSLSSRESVEQPRFNDIPKMMRMPVVVYADYVCCRKENGSHKPIALTFVTVSRIPSIESEHRVFYAPNENYRDFIPAVAYLVELYGRVEKYCKSTKERKKDYKSDELKKKMATTCPFCNCRLVYGKKQNSKVFHHAHISIDYYDGKQWTSKEAGDDICVCCSGCNKRLSYDPPKLPVIFNSDNQGYSVFLQAMGEYGLLHNSSIHLVSTSIDHRKELEMGNIQLRESRQMIDWPLDTMISSIVGNQIAGGSVTDTILRQFFSKSNVLCHEHIQTLFSCLPSILFPVPSAQALEYTSIPQRSCFVNSRSHQVISDNEYKVLEWIWNGYEIKNWKHFISLCSLMNATLLADCMESLRTRFDSFGVDYANYSSLSSLSYSLFLKTGFSHNKSRFVDLGRSWESTLMEKGVRCQTGSLASVYSQTMTEFSDNTGIRLMDNFGDDPWGIIRMLRADVEALCQMQDSQQKAGLQKCMQDALLFPMPYKVMNKDERNAFCEDAAKKIQRISPYNSVGYYFEVVLTIPEQLRNHSTYYSQLDVTTRLLDYRLLQRYIKDGCTIDHVIRAISFSQAPFFYEFFNQLKQSKDSHSEEWYSQVINTMMTDKLLRELCEVVIETTMTLLGRENGETEDFTDEAMRRVVDRELFVPSVKLGNLAYDYVKYLKPFFIAKSLIDVSIMLLPYGNLDCAPLKVVPKPVDRPTAKPPANPIPARPAVNSYPYGSAEVVTQPLFSPLCFTPNKHDIKELP